jgi:hypothetical protein
VFLLGRNASQETIAAIDRIDPMAALALMAATA